MNLRRWDIVFIRVEERDPAGHPAVVLSADDVMADDKQQRFNVVAGTKKKPWETLDNQVDPCDPRMTLMNTDYPRNP